MQVVVSGAAHGIQDVAAAIGLVADQARVFLQFGPFIKLVDQFAAGQFDRGKRRSEFVRCCGYHTAKIRQFLLAGQGHLGGSQGFGHRVHFAGNAAGIARQEYHADGNRGQESKFEDIRHFHNEALVGAQWQMEEQQKRH